MGGVRNSGAAHRGRTPAWLLALLPPLAFVLPEHIERYGRDGLR
jgi:hypothetical protein